MDWMMPEAWDVEHNHLHHYQVRTVVDPEDRPAQSRAARRGFESCYFFAATSAISACSPRSETFSRLTFPPLAFSLPSLPQLGESADPDLVERNMKPLRTGNLPMILRYGQVVGLALIWAVLLRAQHHEGDVCAQGARGEEERRGVREPLPDWRAPFHRRHRRRRCLQGELCRSRRDDQCFAPYATFQFAVLPAVGYAVGGAGMATAALLTSILADVITNVHSFIIIATNHVGDDISPLRVGDQAPLG